MLNFFSDPNHLGLFQSLSLLFLNPFLTDFIYDALIKFRVKKFKQATRTWGGFMQGDQLERSEVVLLWRQLPTTHLLDQEQLGSKVLEMSKVKER